MNNRKKTANRTLRHTFRLTEKENAELLTRAEVAGYRENLSKYIVSVLLNSGKLPPKPPQVNIEYLKKLCDLYYQFQKVGNNYNQVVKAINSRPNHNTVIKLLSMLIGYTRQLKGLSESIISVTEELKKRWLR